jgi:N-acetylglucosaminyldiphosphoundecaprenol N-acetyl-beta-D-mannosaminyltransferase
LSRAFFQKNQVFSEKEHQTIGRRAYFFQKREKYRMEHRKFVASVPFDDLPMEELVEQCRRIREKKGFCALFTPNATMLAAAARDGELLELLNTADVSAVDGDGVLAIAKRQSISLRHGKNAGVEVGMTLLRNTAEAGEGIFLYGGRPGVAETAAKRLRETIPNLKIVGLAHGYGDGEAVAQRVKDSGATLTVVCLGFPRQERWIATNGEAVGGILAGLGGSLDVYAGRVKRAPLLFRHLRLEWLWRCLKEPRRWPSLLRTAGWMARLPKGYRPLGNPHKNPF